MTDRVTLRSGSLAASILPLGATLEQVSYDGTGLTVALDDPASYATNTGYLGALVGPVANRIAGAAFDLDGTAHPLTVNEPPTTTLHGGDAASHLVPWTVAARSETSVTLSLTAPHGQGGFPGNREITASYTLGPQGLTLVVDALSDQATVINFTNHSLWHLGLGPTYGGLTLTLNAARYTPVDGALIPTGAIAAVPPQLDFRTARRLPADGSLPLDHNFVLDGTGLREVARLDGNGLRLTLSTDQPGLQVFDGRSHGYRGLAMEAQRFPDAPNQWPEQVILRPGDRSVQITRWDIEPLD